MYINIIFLLRLVFLLCLLNPIAIADSHYLLCGPDEDGCPPGHYEGCVCVPTDREFDKPHCLDLDHFKCHSLTESISCPDDLYKDQATCLAVLFQSEPTPACVLKSYAFCIKHHIFIQRA